VGRLAPEQPVADRPEEPVGREQLDGSTDLRRALETPDVRERLSEQGVDTRPSSSEEFTSFLRSEVMRWAKVVKEAGIKPQ
jgi:tripartite-type tricarboxylate transporter receptor subunit TctC